MWCPNKSVEPVQEFGPFLDRSARERQLRIRNHSGRFLPFARGVADNRWRRPRDVHRS